MKIELRYFSGTGNSYKILKTCKDKFDHKGHETRILSITEQSTISEEAGLIGFCFPVYAYDIPRMCRNYLLNLPRFAQPIKTFVLVTAGDPEEAGFSLGQSRKILNNNRLDVIYSNVIHMPSNWTVAMNPPPKEEAEKVVESGVEEAGKIADDILCGEQYHHAFNYPPKLSKFAFYKDYYMFKWLGVSNLWRNFRADDTCNACELCEKICPTGSIQMETGQPKWSNTCEQCMRCVNYCPKQAIYQTGYGSVKGKNIYFEPTFKPLKKSIKLRG